MLHTFKVGGGKVGMKSHKEFANPKGRAYTVYERKNIVVVDGYKYFSLKDLKKIDLNVRLSYPADLFKAIADA